MTDIKTSMTRSKQVGNITINCFAEEGKDLLDKIMEAWKEELKNANTDYKPTIYGFAYWLVRYSGLIEAKK